MANLKHGRGREKTNRGRKVPGHRHTGLRERKKKDKEGGGHIYQTRKEGITSLPKPRTRERRKEQNGNDPGKGMNKRGKRGGPARRLTNKITVR